MPQLIVVYDTTETLRIATDPAMRHYAVMALAPGWENRDIYEFSRKLADMLLEQMAEVERDRAAQQ